MVLNNKSLIQKLPSVLPYSSASISPFMLGPLQHALDPNSVSKAAKMANVARNENMKMKYETVV